MLLAISGAEGWLARGAELQLGTLGGFILNFSITSEGALLLLAGCNPCLECYNSYLCEVTLARPRFPFHGNQQGESTLMDRDIHIYLSLMPEALIVSMLSPEQFGIYYAVGSLKKSRGQAMFFEIDPSFRNEFFRIDEAIKRCVPHDDGTPKSSIYVSVYRVLEHVPLDALLGLYLVTPDGRVLGLESTDEIPTNSGRFHLYQEITPVHPLVASTLSPQDFYELIVKTPTSLVSLPSICFVELRLGELAQDPVYGAVRDLPYSNMDHLRQCLVDLAGKLVNAKMIDRVHPAAFPYRMIKNGVFVGNEERLICYALPSQEELRSKHYRWWRSASM